MSAICLIRVHNYFAGQASVTVGIKYNAKGIMTYSISSGIMNWRLTY
ncbi:MAG: hypothetical protein SGJ04_08240 [Bacteroidota bacterium]|nr:hypothetical protein [Bacteroidota bacterium]